MFLGYAVFKNALLSRHCLAHADVLIAPAVKQVDWTDFASYAQLIAEGEKAAEAKLSEIRDTSDRRRGRQFFRKTVHLLGAKLNRYGKGFPWANEKPATIPGIRGSERCWHVSIFPGLVDHDGR